MEKITHNINIPHDELVFLNENQSLTQHFYNLLINAKNIGEKQIILCKNSYERRIVHILSDILGLYHSRYCEWDEYFKKFRDYCEPINKYDGKEHYKIVGVQVSTNLLPLSEKDIKHRLNFYAACKNGHLDVAKWLLTVNPNIDISKNNEYAFRHACGHGHLDVAKWLLATKPNINISAFYESSFRYACKNQHLNVAEWLITLKPWAFKYTMTIKNKHIDSFLTKKYNYALIKSCLFDTSLCEKLMQNRFHPKNMHLWKCWGY